MTKIFLVNDGDGEGDCFFAASTYEKAWEWIKNSQMDIITRYRKLGMTEKQIEIATQYFEDPKELHPYTIQEMEIDKND